MEKVQFIKNKIYNWYIHEKQIITLSVVMGVLVTFSVGLATKLYSDKIVSGISKEVIRFHVLANSDTEIDQELKLKVRDAILEEYAPYLNASTTIDETREILAANILGIQNIASHIIEAEGFQYAVTASLAKDSFPTKTYGDISLPAGEYEALRVEIGEAKGQNWWCVMFPPLCFVDVTKNKIEPEFKEQLKTILTEEEFQLLDNKVVENNNTVKIKFKIIEWWQQRKDETSTIITVKHEDTAIETKTMTE